MRFQILNSKCSALHFQICYLLIPVLALNIEFFADYFLIVAVILESKVQNPFSISWLHRVCVPTFRESWGKIPVVAWDAALRFQCVSVTKSRNMWCLWFDTQEDELRRAARHYAFWHCCSKLPDGVEVLNCDVESLVVLSSVVGSLTVVDVSDVELMFPFVALPKSLESSIWSTPFLSCETSNRGVNLFTSFISWNLHPNALCLSIRGVQSRSYEFLSLLGWYEFIRFMQGCHG